MEIGNNTSTYGFNVDYFSRANAQKQIVSEKMGHKKIQEVLKKMMPQKNLKRIKNNQIKIIQNLPKMKNCN
jgi:hypothetical protein